MSVLNQREFVDRYNELTGLFMRKFRSETRDDNLVFSPFSIISLLSIMADATCGTTKQEVAKLLYGGLQQQEFPEQLKAVREELTKKADYLGGWMDYEDPFFGKPIRDMSEHFHTANAVCVRNDLWESIHPGFQKQLKETYNGVLFSSVDIKEAIKTWMTEMTCKDMLPLLEEALSSESLLAMINTVFFDAMWQYPYDDEDVKMGIFHNADHSESKVFMLHDGGGGYVENDHTTGFVKDFQQCGYSFMALLPKKKGPEALEELMDSVNFYDLMHHQKHVILHSMFPEFSITFKKNLNQIIKSLGIQEAFTNHADFSSISSAQLMVEQMIHQAKIEVDRNGARASAATALVCCGACPPKETKYVMIDRPFVFAILHERLGLPVFVGTVNHVEDIYANPDKLKARLEATFDRIRKQNEFHGEG